MSSSGTRPAGITIAPLADHVQHLPLLADWNFRFWGGTTGRSREGYVARLTGYLRRDRLPIALIALADGAPAGTACINFDDMSARPDLAPWLANLYVESAFRGRGIGSALVRASEDAARRAGHDRLYLYTPDQERLYARLGWQVTARCPHDGESVVVMVRELRSPSRRGPGGRVDDGVHLLSKPYGEEELARKIRAVLPARREPPAPATAAVSGFGRMRVLLVEDEMLVRMSTADMIGALGHEILEAADAGAALRLADTVDGIDVLFTDIGLPDMKGTELAAELRRRHPGVKVILATGYAEPDETERAGVIHLGKPYQAVEAAFARIAEGR